MSESEEAKPEEVWESCPRCDGTGRADPDPVSGLRTQGATMDGEVICPECHGNKGKMVTRPDPAEQ
jgi:DnaJ-class molecular chaperone